MGKIKGVIISVMCVVVAIFSVSECAFGEFLRKVALASAGVYFFSGEDAENLPKSDENKQSSTPSEQSDVPKSDASDEISTGEVITLHRTDLTDSTDYSQFTAKSGNILRYLFTNFKSDDYITLTSKAMLHNVTNVENAVIERLVAQELNIEKTTQPLVLVYHTHTTESYLPDGDYYDSAYPTRSVDCLRNVTAVGDALCAVLAREGISSVHDCTIHDEPYSGAYDRSLVTIEEILRQYPSIKLVLDIHRDGIENPDGTILAPTTTINGRKSAQLMIITGADYLENLPTATFVQNAAESAFPTLTRPILFDYRHYNQSVSSGAILIEIGSQGNTLEQAIYCAELLAEAIAKAIE